MGWGDSWGCRDESEARWVAAASGRGQLGPPRCHRRARQRPTVEPSGALAAVRRRGSRRRSDNAPCCRSCRSFRQSHRSACRPSCRRRPAPPPDADSGQLYRPAPRALSIVGNGAFASPVTRVMAPLPPMNAGARGVPTGAETLVVSQGSAGPEMAGGAAAVSLRARLGPGWVGNATLPTPRCRQCGMADSRGHHASGTRSAAEVDAPQSGS
jgi:hypothetical protein